MRTARETPARLLALGALAIVLVVVLAIVVLGGSGSYRIHARFADAGQLVNGDPVEIGGRPVGSVDDIKLAGDGAADVVLSIDDSAYKPLHVGTNATIRQVGLSGVANRFVGLDPGPDNAAKIPDGGTLPETATHGIVDLDVLLDALDPPTRARLQRLIKDGADLFRAPAASQANAAIRYLNPALNQAAHLGSGLVADQAAFQRLVRDAATVSTTLAQHDAEIGPGITSTAAVLRQIAAQRSAFEDALVRAPAVFQQARGTLARVRSALSGPVDQLLGDLAPSAPKAAHLLAQLSPATHNALPAVREINAFLPSAVSALRSLPGVERLATPALASAVKALREALPIVAGLRPYTPDLVAGFFNGFGGTTSGPYDANGHYSRIQEEIGPESLTGLLSALGNPNLPPLNGQRTGLLARCPGAATEASSDGSNPWVPLASLCDPSESK